jgi:hypothetical protein
MTQEDVLFYANSEKKIIQVLGSQVKGTKLRVYINDRDISDTIDLKELKITVEKPGV